MSLRIKKTTAAHVSNHKEEALAEAVRDDLVRLSTFIPRSLHRRLKLLAAQSEEPTSMGKIVTQACEAYLRRDTDGS